MQHNVTLPEVKEFRLVINSLLSYCFCLDIHRACYFIAKLREYWSENKALSVKGLRLDPSASFSQVLFLDASFLESLQLRDYWSRARIESLGLAVEGGRGALEILRLVDYPTSHQCLRYKHREHSVSITYFPRALFFFANRPFAIFTILTGNNSQLEQ